MPIELPSQRGNHKQSKQIDYRQWHEDDKGGRVIGTEEWLPGTQCSEELGFMGGRLEQPRASTGKAP